MLRQQPAQQEHRMSDTRATSLHILLLEDDLGDAELIQIELQRHGFQALWQHAATEATFRAALSGDTPDLVLADYKLPGFDGLAALGIVLEQCPDVPFIFVSGALGEERAIEALKSGATDYVLKDRLARLPAVVARALSEARTRRERRSMRLALDAQRLLLTTLIDSLPDAVHAIDEQGLLTLANQSLLKELGLPLDEVLGRRLTQINGDELAQEIETQNLASLRTGKPLVDDERAVIAADGRVRWLTYSHVPLRANGRVSGVVCMSREVTERKALEQEILEISNREQRSLGSDLHDGLGQELTGLSLLLKGLEVQLSREAPQYSPHILKITELMSRTIQSTRSLARGLAPVNLERGGLGEALKHLAARCSDMYGLRCAYTHSGGKLPDLEEGPATHLYRIAQEATTNAARYAQASSITIDLRMTTRVLHLAISDDGIGLTAGLSRGPPGLGLKIMEYRARMLGASLKFEEPGVGTRVLLKCPLKLLRARSLP
jgi:two-component system, NarL family, sensor histidine kinase UhpB